jgi:hypothetical protein
MSVVRRQLLWSLYAPDHRPRTGPQLVEYKLFLFSGILNTAYG